MTFVSQQHSFHVPDIVLRAQDIEWGGKSHFGQKFWKHINVVSGTGSASEKMKKERDEVKVLLWLESEEHPIKSNSQAGTKTVRKPRIMDHCKKVQKN